MKHNKFLVLISVLAFTLTVGGCGKPKDNRKFTTETISHEEWAVDNFFTVFRYKWVSNITEYWGHTVESNVDFSTVSETPDVYKELQYRVLPKYRTADYRLRSVSITVKAETDCKLDFTIGNTLFMAESLDNAFIAGQEQTINFNVNKPCNEIFSLSEFANSELDWGFTIGTYKFEEVKIVPDVAAHYNRRVNGIAYATKPSAPEIKVSFSKIMLTLDIFDR